MTEFNFKPLNYPKFGGGMQTLEEADTIPDDACVYAQNIDLSSGGAIGPRKGKTALGNVTAGIGSVSDTHTVKKRDGSEIPMRVRGTVLEFYAATPNTWDTLLTGLTADKTMGFADYVTSTYDRVYFGNGVDTTRKWNAAVTYLTGDVAAVDTTINVSDTTGFDASGSIIIEGDTITYTGKTSTTFTGCGAIATTHATGKSVAQITATTTIELGNILMVKDWRFTVAGTPTKGPTMTISAINDPEDYTESSPRVVGDPTIEDFPEGGGEITSLAEFDKWWVVFKEDTIRLFTLDITQGAGGSNDLEVPITKGIVSAPGIGALSHKGTVGADNDVYYVSKNGGLRSISNVVSEKTQLTIKDWFDVIRPTIKDYSFDAAATSFWDKKVLVACKSSDEVSYNDTVVVLDLRTKALSIFKGWNVACWFVYSNSLYFGSSNDANTYKAFDGYTDISGTSEILIDAIWRSKRFNFGEPAKEKEIDLVYVEGLIAVDTELEVTIHYDEEGSRTTVTKTIAGDGEYVTETPANGTGIDELGTEPLAGSIEEVNDLNRFRVYLTMPAEYAAYNLDIQFRCQTLGGRWKVNTYAFNPILRDEPNANLKL